MKEVRTKKIFMIYERYSELVYVSKRRGMYGMYLPIIKDEMGYKVRRY